MSYRLCGRFCLYWVVGVMIGAMCPPTGDSRFFNLTNYTSNDISDEDTAAHIKDATKLVNYSKEMKYNYTFESCAGPWLKVPGVELRGCMNEKEAKNLGINDVEFQHGKRNRDFCLAPLNRVEMLEGHKCLHNCKYCFLTSSLSFIRNDLKYSIFPKMNSLYFSIATLSFLSKATYRPSIISIFSK